MLDSRDGMRVAIYRGNDCARRRSGRRQHTYLTDGDARVPARHVHGWCSNERDLVNHAT
jgi:hypothetical protein